MEQFDFVMFGNCTTNQILRFEEMPEVGKTTMACNTHASECLFGGCAFNVFYAMVKLGIRIRPVMRYSDPRFKDKIYGILEEYHLPSEYIRAPQMRSYNTCLLLQDKNQNHMTIMYRFGEDSHLQSFYDEQIEILPEHFENVKMVMMVMGNPKSSYRIMEQIEKHNLDFAFSYRNDPALLPKELLEVILPKAKIIFTNEVEQQYLSNLFGWKHITDLMDVGKAEVIVTTLGSHGSIVYSRDASGAIQSVKVPITKCEVEDIDAVGAGDGYVAGFMYGYIHGKSMECCAQYGSTLSSFVLEKSGSTTNLPNLEQLLERNSRRPDARND